MRLIAAFVLCLSIGLSGCLKKTGDCQYKLENKVAPVSEEQAVLNYIYANYIKDT